MAGAVSIVLEVAGFRPNSDRVLVSRKAMQNYNRFMTWQNIYTKKLRKKSLFCVLEGFGTPVWTFGTLDADKEDYGINGITGIACRTGRRMDYI